jgi:hypothetical protein
VIQRLLAAAPKNLLDDLLIAAVFAAIALFSS